MSWNGLQYKFSSSLNSANLSSWATFLWPPTILTHSYGLHIGAHPSFWNTVTKTGHRPSTDALPTPRGSIFTAHKESSSVSTLHLLAHLSSSLQHGVADWGSAYSPLKPWDTFHAASSLVLTHCLQVLLSCPDVELSSHWAAFCFLQSTSPDSFWNQMVAEVLSNPSHSIILWLYLSDKSWLLVTLFCFVLRWFSLARGQTPTQLLSLCPSSIGHEEELGRSGLG